ncbi:MAG: MFS transporter, partial [Candidatus Woesearchaeota archaeon]
QLKLALTANSFFLLAAGMLGPIYAFFVKDIGGDVLAAGGSWAVFMIVSGLGMFVMGKIQDKIKKDKPVMIVGYTLQSIGFLGYFFVANVTQLFIVQIVLGLSTVIQLPAYDSFYTKYLEKGKFASQWAAWEGVYYTITGIAALIGAFLVKIFGFKILFLVMFFWSLIGLLIATQLKEKE